MWFSTVVIGIGVAIDTLIYSIPVPVIPFQLQKLGYDNVSSRVGWLLFAYSGGIVFFTPFIAAYSERYQSRKWPLVFGLLALAGSQVLFMEAPAYWVMCLARVLQGLCTAVVFTVGMALVCDITPEKQLGRQLGLMMSSLTLGMLIGPPISGALYGRFGFRAPYIFGILFTAVDLVARLLLIERKEALAWGIDTLKSNDAHITNDTEAREPGMEMTPIDTVVISSAVSVMTANNDGHLTRENITQQSAQGNPQPHERKPMSELKVVLALSRSPRALSAIVCTFVYTIALTSLEPTLPLHLESVWNLNSSIIGVVLIAAVVPSIISSPLAGWWSDYHGPEWVVFGGILLTLPWWGIIMIRGPLAVFIVTYAFESLFGSAFMTPLMTELTAVARGKEGIGYAHVHGAFNFTYGLGSAIGPLIAGQLYDHTKDGWVAVCSFVIATLFIPLTLSFCFCGPLPLAVRLRERWSKMRRARAGGSSGDTPVASLPLTC